MGIKYAVNADFFTHWSNEMAYVLGFIFADGSLEDASYLRGKYVRATCTDKDRIEAIKSLMSSGHSIVRLVPGGNRKPRYLLRIGSHKLYADLISHGVTPRKSLTMKFPEPPRRFSAAFIRGYFDGDGCVFLDRYHKNPALEYPRRLTIIFTSGSVEFLQSLHECIQRECKITEHCLHPHNKLGAFQLRYSTASSVKIFAFMYKHVMDPRLYLSRKYAIFRRFFEERPDWYDRRTKFIIKDNSGLVAKKSTRRSAKLICEGANPSQASKKKAPRCYTCEHVDLVARPRITQTLAK